MNYILSLSNFELEEITKLASKSRRVYNRLRAKTFPLSLWADTFSMIGETFENVIICFICSEGNPFLKESKPIKIISEGMYTYITNGLNLALKELDEGRDEDRFSNYLYNLQKQLWYWKENIFDKWPQFREEDIPRVPKGGLFSLMVLSPGNPFAVSRWSMR